MSSAEGQKIAQQALRKGIGEIKRKVRSGDGSGTTEVVGGLPQHSLLAQTVASYAELAAQPQMAIIISGIMFGSQK